MSLQSSPLYINSIDSFLFIDSCRINSMSSNRIFDENHQDLSLGSMQGLLKQGCGDATNNSVSVRRVEPHLSMCWWDTPPPDLNSICWAKIIHDLLIVPGVILILLRWHDCFGCWSQTMSGSAATWYDSGFRTGMKQDGLSGGCLACHEISRLQSGAIILGLKLFKMVDTGWHVGATVPQRMFSPEQHLVEWMSGFMRQTSPYHGHTLLASDHGDTLCWK